MTACASNWMTTMFRSDQAAMQAPSQEAKGAGAFLGDLLRLNSI